MSFMTMASFTRPGADGYPEIDNYLTGVAQLHDAREALAESLRSRGDEHQLLVDRYNAHGALQPVECSDARCPHHRTRAELGASEAES